MESTAENQNQPGWWLSWYGDPPATTRDRILFAAFKEVHLNGFQAASIQNIINSAGVTKGALYHHFSSKDDIGYALLDEIFAKYVASAFIEPLQSTDDPITALTEHLQESGAQMSEEDIALGCPLDHFSQEMAAIDVAFQKRIEALYQRKNSALVLALKRGQLAGNVTSDVAAESIALMINATLQGCMAMAKNARSLETLMQCGAGLIHYLEQLRPKPVIETD
jgi:AcrR family transcriptional regulator